MSPNIDDRLVALNAQRAILFLLVSIGAASAAGLVYYSLIKPIFIAALLSYLVLPAVSWLEGRNVRRSVASVTIIFLIFALLIFGIARLVPIAYTKSLHLLAMAPGAAQTIELEWLPIIRTFLNDFGITGTAVDDAFNRVNVIEEVRIRLQSGISGLWATWTSLLGGALNVVLIPVVTYFLLVEWRRIGRGVASLIPADLSPAVKDVFRQVNRTFRNVIKGQLTVAGVLMILYIIGFGIIDLIFGFPFAFLIAVIAGLCRVVPYLDVIVGGALSTVVILSNFESWGQLLGVMAVFAAVQAVDGVYITPRIIGERVGIHPLVVVLSVFALGDWFGFWGVLLAIPSVAVAKILIKAILPYYRQSHVYQGKSYKP